MSQGRETEARRIVLLNGPAGAGKSTLGRRLAATSRNGACVHGDYLKRFVVARESGTVRESGTADRASATSAAPPWPTCSSMSAMTWWSSNSSSSGVCTLNASSVLCALRCRFTCSRCGRPSRRSAGERSRARVAIASRTHRIPTDRYAPRAVSRGRPRRLHRLVETLRRPERLRSRGGRRLRLRGDPPASRRVGQRTDVGAARGLENVG